MPLVSQASYARHRGVSREAVRQRTVTVGGPIPVHGPRKLLDPAEADALWEATKSAAGASHGNGGGSPLLGSELARAAAARTSASSPRTSHTNVIGTATWSSSSPHNN